MRKNVAYMLSLLLIFSLFTACNQTNDEDNSGSREIVDMIGRTVVVPENVERIFIDWPSGVTLALTLGAVDKLAVVQTQFQTDTHAWARIIIPALENIPVDDAPTTNIEAVLNYEPQVVFTNTFTTHTDAERYENIGIPVVVISFTCIDTFKESMLIVGEVLGGQYKENAIRFNQYFDDNIAFVQDRLRDIDEVEKNNIYYADSRFSDAYHTIGTGEIQESWINIAGGRLATADYFSGRNIEINAETFLSINPDMILVGAQNQAKTYEMIMADNVLAELSAVENGQVFRIPQGVFPWCRTGPEAAIQVIWAAKLLHPDLFSDVDVAGIAQGFYREFFGADVSNEYILRILEGRLSPTGE